MNELRKLPLIAKMTISLLLLFVLYTFVLNPLVIADKGNIINNSPTDAFWLVAFGLLGISAFLYINYKMYIKLLLFIVLVSFNTACINKVKSNQTVVYSTDCGANWEYVKQGETVPLGTGNYCFMRVYIPVAPLQGETDFFLNMQNNIRAGIEIGYMYNITDPMKFIKKAKTLGKSNVDPDDEEAVARNFDKAENTIIRKIIKDITKQKLANQDPLTLDITKVEEQLMPEFAKKLATLGLTLDFIELTVQFPQHTAEAIDILNSLKLYENNNELPFGRKITIERAGAATINIINGAGDSSDIEVLQDSDDDEE